MHIFSDICDMIDANNRFFGLRSATDYFPFGMEMPGRNFSSEKYRFGFNGKENDNEVKGNGNQQDYGQRISDTRLGKFLSVDPISYQYPELTPYQFASNSPIWGIDLDGLEIVYANFTQHFAIPVLDVVGVSGGFETGLMLECRNKEFHLISYHTMNLGVSAGFGFSFNTSFGVYPTAQDYTQLMGWGMTAGYSGKNLSGSVNVSISDNPKIGFEGSIKKTTFMSFGKAGFFDGTYTNLIDDYGPLNPKNIDNIATIASQDIGISSSQTKTVLNTMLQLGNKIANSQKVEENNNSRSSKPKSQTTNSTYTIKKGDTLSGIANKFKTTVTDLQNLNGIQNPDKINAGTQIKTK